MFVAAVENDKRPKQASSCFTCHRNLVWLSEEPRNQTDKATAFRRLAAVAGRMAGHCGDKKPRLFLRLQKTLQSVISVWGGVCWREDESCGRISGSAGVSNFATPMSRRRNVCVCLETPSTRLIQDSLVQTSWTSKETSFIFYYQILSEAKKTAWKSSVGSDPQVLVEHQDHWTQNTWEHFCLGKCIVYFLYCFCILNDFF